MIETDWIESENYRVVFLKCEPVVAPIMLSAFPDCVIAVLNGRVIRDRCHCFALWSIK